MIISGAERDAGFLKLNRKKVGFPTFQHGNKSPNFQSTLEEKQPRNPKPLQGVCFVCLFFVLFCFCFFNARNDHSPLKGKVTKFAHFCAFFLIIKGHQLLDKTKNEYLVEMTV